MSDGATPRSSYEEGPDEHRDLERLGRRLRQARGNGSANEEEESRTDSLPTNGLGDALRIGIELVVAVFVGVGIGWFLDRLLGTEPWLLVLFFLLGAVAGFMNVIRVANRMNTKSEDTE